MKTTVIFLLNKSKQNKRTKKIPIYLRVIHNFSKAEARLNAEINPEEEFLWNPVSMRFSDRDSLINQQLNNVETEFRKFIILNETKLSEFSAKDIRDLVMGVKRGRKNISIADFISSYYDNIVSPNQSLTKGSKKNYQKSN
jgi:hypothetical protein